MKHIVSILICSFSVCAIAGSARALETRVDHCLAAARERAATDFGRHGSADLGRLQLEVDAARCLDPSLTPEAAHATGSARAARARMARDFVAGSLPLATYRVAREGVTGKLERLLANPAEQQMLLKGDADGDLVSDARDQCARTPSGTPTDERGCPIKIVPSTSDEHDERTLHSVLSGSQTLCNVSCKNAPPPLASAPLEWGRGQQTRYNSAGFNFAVAKAGGQPKGCEIFYEIQLRFIEPLNVVLPPSRIVTVVFSAAEDLLDDPRRAIFGLSGIGTPSSPSRAAALQAVATQYARISWRVRTVNGGNQTSHWSPFITQGPALSGVAG